MALLHDLLVGIAATLILLTVNTLSYDVELLLNTFLLLKNLPNERSLISRGSQPLILRSEFLITLRQLQNHFIKLRILLFQMVEQRLGSYCWSRKKVVPRFL